MTLTGVGGVGKTRLALQVAAEVVTEFPSGAWLCEFAPVADPDAVWETLGASLRVQAFPGRSLEESVLEYLTARQMLLVLDNCEHLLDAIARQVTAITQHCARVSVLATSREGLGLAGERIVAVSSLGVPADDADVDALMGADAVQLFSDRARMLRLEVAVGGCRGTRLPKHVWRNGASRTWRTRTEVGRCRADDQREGARQGIHVAVADSVGDLRDASMRFGVKHRRCCDNPAVSAVLLPRQADGRREVSA